MKECCHTSDTTLSSRRIICYCQLQRSQWRGSKTIYCDINYCDRVSLWCHHERYLTRQHILQN